MKWVNGFSTAFFITMKLKIMTSVWKARQQQQQQQQQQQNKNSSNKKKTNKNINFEIV